MQLNERTLQVLKNFSAINPSILVRPGSTLETMAPTKKIVARASVAEEFDREFAIYDLSRFLGAMSLFKEPELVFGNESVAIKADGRTLKYVFAAPEMVIAPPAKGIKFPSEEAAPHVGFDLTAKVIQDVTKAASVLGMPELAIIGANGELRIATSDTKNPTSHSYSIAVGETDHRFSMIFRLDTFKFLPGDYKVVVSLKKIAHFAGDPAEYFIVAEDTSVV